MSYPDRLAVARDALLHLMKDLQKILQEGIQAVLVCPHWPTVLWWPVLVDMLVEPLLIATCSSILFSCFTSRIRIFEVLSELDLVEKQTGDSFNLTSD